MKDIGRLFELTVLSISQYLNEVEKIGFCKNVTFTYDSILNSSTRHDESIPIFTNLLIKLCYSLNDVEKTIKHSFYYNGQCLSSNDLYSGHSQVNENFEELIPSLSSTSNLVYTGNSSVQQHFVSGTQQSFCVTNECQNPSESLCNKFQQEIVTEQNIYHSNDTGISYPAVENNVIDNDVLNNTSENHNSLICSNDLTHQNSMQNSSCPVDYLQPSQDALTYGSIPYGDAFESYQHASSNVSSKYDAASNSVTSQVLDKTILSFSETDNNYCSICSKEFRSLKSRNIHLKKAHNGKKNDNIPLSSSEKDLDIPFYCCRHCGWTCKELPVFLRHSCVTDALDGADQNGCSSFIDKTTELVNVKKFLCGCCGAEFRSVARMSYHLPRCSPGPFSCGQCSISYETRTELNYHKEKTHPGEKCFNCTECGKQFVRKASLRKHVVTSHEKNSTPSLTSPKGQYSCDLCSKRFIKSIFLTNHKLRMHNLAKNFLCQICGKKLLTSYSLKCHMDIHSNERNFQCRFCQKRFLRKEKLILHERIHTKEKPFVCEKCSKSFISKTRLNEHLRGHVAEKRFQCPRCPNSYSSAWDVKRHSKSKHGADISSQQVKLVLKPISKLP